MITRIVCSTEAFPTLVIVAAILEVNNFIEAKIIRPTEKEIYLRVGHGLHLQCQSSDQSSVRWSRKGPTDDAFYTIPATGSYYGFYTTAKKEHGRGSERDLHKDSVQLTDEGSYRCQSNTSPSDVVAVKIIEINVTSGMMGKSMETTFMECDARDGSNFTRYNVSWQKNNRTIENMINKYKILENGTLAVLRPGEKDIGEYTCIVHIGLTKERNFTEKAYLFSHPFVRSSEKSLNIREGSPVGLKCYVWGWPLPEITWYRNDDPLNITGDPRISVANDTPIRYSHVTLNSVRFDDRAWYTCSATSDKWPLVVSNATILVRIKGRLAALWPLLGICAEFLILGIIVFIYERKRMMKKSADDEDANKCDGTTTTTTTSSSSRHHANCNASSQNEENVRHRK